MGRPERRLWFRLARQLKMPVRELQHRMSSREFSEWIAYDSIDPGEPERGDYRHAMLSCLVANLLRWKGPKLKLKNFLPDFKPRVRLTWKDIKKKLVFWKAGHNVTVEKPKGK